MVPGPLLPATTGPAAKPMFFLIPFATDCERRRPPIMTVALIVLNSMVWVMQFYADEDRLEDAIGFVVSWVAELVRSPGVREMQPGEYLAIALPPMASAARSTSPTFAKTSRTSAPIRP